MYLYGRPSHRSQHGLRARTTGLIQYSELSVRKGYDNLIHITLFSTYNAKPACLDEQKLCKLPLYPFT